MTSLKQALVALSLIFTGFISYAQSYEGSITYKVEAHNPNPEMIPDSLWQKGIKEQFGERGYMLQKYFYKQGRYVSEIDAGTQTGYQAYNPEDGLLYSWQEGSDTALTVDSKKYMDKFVEIVPSEETETILGIACKSLIVKSEMGEMTFWYNSDHFKMDAKLYKDHLYGHWEQILGKTGCLPLKIEQKAFMTHLSLTAIDFKEAVVNDEKFTIPEFKEGNGQPRQLKQT